MTNGEKLKKQLNLEAYDNVYISYIIGSSPNLYVIYFDSLRPRMPISSQYLKRYSNITFYKNGRELRSTGLMDLTRSNVNLNTGTFVKYDVAMSHMSTRESHNKAIKDFSLDLDILPQFNFKEGLQKLFVGNLKELTLKDLKDGGNSTTPTSTMDWRKDRNKLGYTENKASKLVDLSLSEGDDSFTFYFLTESTQGSSKFSSENRYNYDDPKGEVNPKNLKIKDNPSKLYEIQIKFLGLNEFVEYLNTTPNDKVTKSEIAYLIENYDCQIFSNSPSWQFQGFNYIASELDLSIFPTNIPSKVWMPNRFNGEFMLDKHTKGLINQISFFSQQMAQMLGTKLRDRGLI